MADSNGPPIPTFPTAEPSSVLTFGNLITEVAYKIGCASYGTSGTGAPDVPTDAHDLAVCQRIVNKALRMFIHDAPPPNGWRWIRPVAQVDLYPQISYDTSAIPRTFVQITANSSGPLTGTSTLTLSTPATGDVTATPSYVPAFFESMELRTIYLNGNPPVSVVGYNPPIAPDRPNNSPVTATITRSSTTATVTVPSGTAGWAVGNTVNISGAAQPQYNGNQVILALTSTTFTFTVAGSPATPATGSITAAFLGQVGTPFTILQYLSPTQIVVDGDATILGFPTNCPFSFAQLGDYTLPANFGGQYCGEITYVQNTNRGMILSWTDEATIRSRRQNYNVESGTPYAAAVRLMPTPSYRGVTNASGLMSVRRRWELMTWRISSEYLSIVFPYVLHFQNMVNLTDVSPAPFAHDETIKAACLAVAEKEVTDSYGVDWEYYQKALQNSYRIDAMSAPKRIGYFGNPSGGFSRSGLIQQFRGWDYQRPVVGVNPLS